MLQGKNFDIEDDGAFLNTRFRKANRRFYFLCNKHRDFKIEKCQNGNYELIGLSVLSYFNLPANELKELFLEAIKFIDEEEKESIECTE